ncbi:hypothetical protein C8A05DRAFT_48158 [Staphylotrichum tortipilum]|uniref:NACHT domain-containing protein n=1 Tax=Staphylotrichum tortipilum TaxID=2831512 RepID=A0AAN6RNZ1_9PEZI|nr:hypothetical protein C8A05DRAFT_48158 [Staphylotrichum longicolle]
MASLEPTGLDYTHTHLPWVWAPIKLILKISSDYTEAFDRIMKAYSQIAECLGRFQLLERSFKGQPQLYPVFVIFYVDILRFHKAAYKFLTRRCWKLLFMTTWGRFEREFKTIIEDLKRHEDLIDKEVNAHDIVEARAMREALTAWRTESLARLAREEKQQTARQMQAAIIWLRLDDSDQIVLSDALTKVGAGHPGTVDWVLKRRQVSSWLGPSADTPFLCLQGGPGTGKSVMVAQLVSFLNSSKSSLVIRHFCSYTHDSSTQYDHIIKSLLLQFAQHSADLVAHIHDEYIGSRQATVGILEDLLEMAVDLLSGNGQRGIHILLDGLDECPIDKQRSLLRLMKCLTSGRSNCKVLISSRDVPPLPARARKAVLSLAEEKACLRDTITTYARIRLLAIGDNLRELGISEDEIKHISSHIGQRADGMFLWATLVLNYLSANFFYTGDEFMKAVDTLPQELTAFYEKLLSRILTGLDTRSALRLRAIFGWIAFAKRPLRKAELQSALMFQPDEVIGDRPVPAQIFERCKPLIEERSDSTLTFIHISVKESYEASGDFSLSP